MDTGLVDDLLFSIAPGEGAKLLDVGCGSGEFTRALFRRCSVSVTITAVDRDPNLSQEFGDGISFKVGDAYDLPFEDGTFDVAYSNAMFHTIRNPLTVVAEMVRVVRPGGVIVLSDGDASLSYEPRTPPTCSSDKWQLDYFIGRKLGRFLEQAGLIDVSASVSARVDGTGDVPKITCYRAPWAFVVARGRKSAV